MSWAAHQFEYYAIQGHLPKRWQGKVSFLAIVAGDLSCDLVGKVWVYGVDFGGTHYGPAEPAQFHRGWPGEGFSHSIAWAFALAAAVWLLTKSRAWTAGVLLGAAAHVMTDITDSVGTMLAFPFSTETFSVGAWAYGATPGGRNLDGAAYYSSLGMVMDLVWLGLALTNWRCLTTAWWREHVVAADPAVWGWLGRRLPERALVTLYRSWFLYGVTRLVAWTVWAHTIAGAQWDLSWGGPSWMTPARLAEPRPLAAVVAVSVAALAVWAALAMLARVPVSWFARDARAPTRRDEG